LLALLALGFAMLAACGGDDDDADNPFVPGGSGDQSSDGDGDGDAGNGDDNGDGDSVLEGFEAADGMAVVTIGNERYEFAMTRDGTNYGNCLALFGLMSGTGYTTDGRNITLEFEMPPPDYESFDRDDRYENARPQITVDIEDPRQIWVADMQQMDVDGNTPSQVDEWVLDGSRTAGSATFYDSWAYVTGGSEEPVLGTFEIAC
jgi:hypothetical protein